jgi:uncharacterized protein (TIGR03083 family)
VEPATHLELLSQRAGALLRAAAGAMDVPVPTCPDWTVADLVAHMGLVWGWAADTVTAKARADGGQAPVDRSDQALRAWAKGEATRLVDTLRASEPDADCWTFGPPRSVRFWFRRQALETVLHAWDTERAVGASAHIDPEIAVDGIDEHLQVIVPRSVARRSDAWSGQSVHLHCTDADGEWVVRLGPDGQVATERAHAKADVALRGTAEALWLWCANRATPDDLAIERLGDEEIAARWRVEMGF